MRQETDENENDAENEGPRTNRRGELLISTVEIWRRGEKEPKRVKGAAGGLALFATFASNDSAPFTVPPPLSQRACQRDPCEYDPRHSSSSDGCNC